MKVFISQPMEGFTIKELLDRRLDIFITFCQLMSNRHPDLEIELIDSYDKSIPMDICDVDKRIVWSLGDNIRLMAEADLVIFDTDWKEDRGCCIEHEICERYNIPNTKYSFHSFTEWKKLELLPDPYKIEIEPQELPWTKGLINVNSGWKINGSWIKES